MLQIAWSKVFRSVTIAISGEVNVFKTRRAVLIYKIIVLVCMATEEIFLPISARHPLGSSAKKWHDKFDTSAIDIQQNDSMSYYHPSYHFLFVEQVCGSQYQLPAVEAPKFQWPTGNYSGQNLEITESIVDEWLRNFCNLRHLPSVYMVKKNKQRKVFLWRLCRWTSFWLAPGFGGSMRVETLS